MGNSYYNIYKKKDEPLNGWFYIFILYLSFIWLCLYTTESSLVLNFSWSYGKLFDFASANFFYEVLMLFVQAAVYLIVFEIIFWMYRYTVSFKVYAFVIPYERFKADSRLYFALRNLIYGICLNLCFLYPYLYSFSPLFNLAITMIVFLFYVRHICKKYSEPIVSHFVFKTFAFPIFFYEAIIVLFYIWRWI